ncbi:MAG: RnfH family protein [Burkholderiaceae bacterium]
MASDGRDIRIQICYARPDFQLLKDVIVARGTTIEEAIRFLDIAIQENDIDLASCKVGLYGKIKAPDTQLRDGDRIEIYRPLQADPKDARRRRAQKKTKL